MIVRPLTFAAGDKVRVYQKVKEGDKTRTQIFEGTVVVIKGRGMGKTLQVQKMVGNVSVERIWPLASPNLVKVELKEKSAKRIRRANLTYMHLPKIS